MSTRFSNARQRVRKSAHSSQTFSGYHVQKCAHQICVHRQQHFNLIVPQMKTQQKCICIIKIGTDQVFKFKNHNNKIKKKKTKSQLSSEMQDFCSLQKEVLTDYHCSLDLLIKTSQLKSKLFYLFILNK